MDAASACEPVEREGAASTAGPARVTDQGHAQPRVRDPSRLRRTARRLARSLRPQAWAIGVGVGTFFGAAAIDPLLPALFKQLIDRGFKGDVGFPIWLVPLAIIGLFAVRGLLAFSGAYLFAWSSSKGVLALRTDLIDAVMAADA